MTTREEWEEAAEYHRMLASGMKNTHAIGAFLSKEAKERHSRVIEYHKLAAQVCEAMAGEPVVYLCSKCKWIYRDIPDTGKVCWMPYGPLSASGGAIRREKNCGGRLRRAVLVPEDGEEVTG